MKSPFRYTLDALAVVLVGAPLLMASVASVNAEDESARARPFDVFVDLPTRFAYINTPQGWRYIRQLSMDEVRRLPASTLTSAKAH